MVHQPSATGQSEAGAEDEGGVVELAPYMSQLQTLTHKLGLSIQHSNHRLAEFYLYETLEALEDIKIEVPEYRGQAIALLVDRLATPTYTALQTAIKEDKTEGPDVNERSAAVFTAVVQSCNQCHAVTKHEFIKITDKLEANPFIQDFSK